MHRIGITAIKLNITPTSNISRIVGFGQRRATIESINSNTCHAIADSNRGQRRATSESILYTDYAIRDGDGGEGGATIERLQSNARYAIRNSNGGEGGAILESLLSNTCNAIRDSNRGEGAAIKESLISNAGYTIGSAVIGDGFGDNDFA